MAFRSAITLQSSRKRFDSWHIDLQDQLSNYGACRMYGGLNLLAKILGKPGKCGVPGIKFTRCTATAGSPKSTIIASATRSTRISSSCGSRVLTGDLSLDREQQIVQAREFLEDKAIESPMLKEYLANWERDFSRPNHARQNGPRPPIKKCQRPRTASRLLSAFTFCRFMRRQPYCTNLVSNCIGASQVIVSL